MFRRFSCMCARADRVPRTAPSAACCPPCARRDLADGAPAPSGDAVGRPPPMASLYAASPAASSGPPTAVDPQSLTPLFGQSTTWKAASACLRPLLPPQAPNILSMLADDQQRDLAPLGVRRRLSNPHHDAFVHVYTCRPHASTPFPRRRATHRVPTATSLTARLPPPARATGRPLPTAPLVAASPAAGAAYRPPSTAAVSGRRRAAAHPRGGSPAARRSRLPPRGCGVAWGCSGAGCARDRGVEAVACGPSDCASSTS
jgi:hypothetical protein